MIISVPFYFSRKQNSRLSLVLHNIAAHPTPICSGHQGPQQRVSPGSRRLSLTQHPRHGFASSRLSGRLALLPPRLGLGVLTPHSELTATSWMCHWFGASSFISFQVTCPVTRLLTVDIHTSTGYRKLWKFPVEWRSGRILGRCGYPRNKQKCHKTLHAFLPSLVNSSGLDTHLYAACARRQGCAGKGVGGPKVGFLH